MNTTNTILDAPANVSKTKSSTGMIKIQRSDLKDLMNQQTLDDTARSIGEKNL